MVGLDLYYLLTKKDFLYFHRNIVKNNPNVKIIVCNFFLRSMIMFVDPKCAKEVT